VESLQRL
jgi:uncharacterized protein (DUF3084 family)